MTADPTRLPAASNQPTSPVLVVECDKTWQARPLPARPLLAGGRDPLASALLGFLQLPIVQVLGTARITGHDGSRLVGLTEVQQRGFSRTLTTLLAMPDYLALHTQACRISASWVRP